MSTAQTRGFIIEDNIADRSVFDNGSSDSHKKNTIVAYSGFFGGANQHIRPTWFTQTSINKTIN